MLHKSTTKIRNICYVYVTFINDEIVKKRIFIHLYNCITIQYRFLKEIGVLYFE